MKKIYSLALQVDRSDGELTRKKLIEQDILRKDLKIEKSKDHIYFPIKERKRFPSSWVIEKKLFCPSSVRIKSYQDIVEIPDDLVEFLPVSYDIIGSIILIKIPNELLEHKSLIGAALLKVNTNCSTVCDIEPVKGDLRLRNVEVIAGEKSLVTEHREYGFLYKLDVSKVYFSPRLASERKRVADLVGNNEIIVDMFAGVAPFAILMAGLGNPKRVVAIDKNRDAVRFAKINVLRNHVGDVVDTVCDDSGRVDRILGNVKADRIIMNLPFGGFDFFSNALSIANKSCMIHYYEVIGLDDVKQRMVDLKECAINNGFRLIDICVNRIKSYAPYEFYMGFDIVAQLCADVA